jgi:hypothetical protein
MGHDEAFLPVTSGFTGSFPDAQLVEDNFSRQCRLWDWTGQHWQSICRSPSAFSEEKGSEAFNPDGYVRSNWSRLGSKSLAAMLGNALREATKLLTTFARSEGFFQGIGLAFGNAFLGDRLQSLRQQWATRDFRDLPAIEVRSSLELNGALSAYSQTTNTIYLSQSFLNQYVTDSLAITNILLEEFGHFVDAQINLSDAPGDEGEIFAALVQGVYLSEARLQALKAEDDRSFILLDGQLLQVEQATATTGDGLRGEYFDNANLTNLGVARIDGTVDFNWGTGSPDPAIAPNTFSVRWTGQVQPTTSGTYTFFTQTDDGVRLWVNGTQLINNWTTGGYRERSGTIALVAGQQYDIRLEYYENTSSATARLLWSGPGVTRQVIPQSQLFSPAPVDSTPPTATATAANVATSGETTYDFTVTYSDNVAINISSLDNNDVRVTGPNSFNQLASLVSVNTPGNGTPRTATYRITAPGGTWDAGDNGTYTLALQANQVSDTSNNFAAASTLGTFSVNLTPLAGGDGLRGEYFDNINFTNLIDARIDSTVDFDWGIGSPNPAIAPDTFSVRWTGQVQPPTSGTYTFFTQSDDGIRLWVNGQQIINNWTDHAPTENSGTISLAAGQKYDIRLEYYENGGGAVARLLWSGPGLSKQVIPQSQLFSGASEDFIPPTAQLVASNILNPGGTIYQFNVRYSDNTAMNVATFNGSDILVTGPNGFSQSAALVSVSDTRNGTPRTATYQITAPGGSWDAADNGTYTLTLQPNQVSDTRGNFLPSSILGTFLVSLSTGNQENIVFPADAGVLNVKDFGAKGDGVTDDTAAIQAALNAYPNGMRIIYLPNGTYLVSGTLTWPAGTPGSGNEYKNTILQGQSEQGVVIKLKDGAAGFTNVASPKAVIFTGPAPAQRFGNSIRNLTVDTGMGNPGAIGIQFNASNQGSMRQVTIRSGDGQGVNGLDMNFTDEIGPLLVKGVTVNGFQYGIRTGFTVNSQTLENITLNNQSVYGFYNTGQVINIRGLTSNNAVTAIYNAGGRMTVIDSTLNGIGNASSQPAIKGDFPLDLVVRNITTSGYQSAIQNAGTTLAGPNIPEFVSGPILSQFPTPLQTLNLPIRETPDVPWDDPNTTPWANVISFGAIPNDGLDDTAAIQAAIDSGRTTVYFPVGVYNLQGTVFVRNNARRILGTEAYIDMPNSVNPGFKVVDGNSPVVVMERFQTGFNSTPTIENASSRTLVIRDAVLSGNMTGPGDVFIENVVSNPFANWTFNGQNVWARQLNVENTGTHIINNGANLWILGLKTERGGTLIDTRAGGKTEVLGGLAYTTTATLDGTQNDPLFISNESSISVTLGEINYGGGPNYTTYVREIRGGVTRNLPASGLSNYMGSGKHIPLYVGYPGN